MILLVVEDSPDDELLMLRALRTEAVAAEIYVARDGAEALRRLGIGTNADRTTPLPDVVLLDLKLPYVDGRDVLRRIRDDDRAALLPVVVLSSSGDPSEVESVYALGASSYVRKPVDSAEFMTRVRQVGSYWCRVNQPPRSDRP